MRKKISVVDIGNLRVDQGLENIKGRHPSILQRKILRFWLEVKWITLFFEQIFENIVDRLLQGFR